MSSYLGSGAIVFVQVRDKAAESDHHPQEHIIGTFKRTSDVRETDGHKGSGEQSS